MASDDRDDQSKSSKPSNDNPFIKFRKFADEQVGSLLQSVIGLPSAFSKGPAGTVRWAEFDEELRRRDELQVRQKELRDSLSEKQEYTHRAHKESIHQKDSVPIYQPRNEKRGQDVQLYCQVSKALFAHLLPPGTEYDPIWKQPNGLDSMSRGLLPEYFPFRLKQDQHPKNNMELLQLLAYNEIESSPTLRSNYSILPYLLFSPYSPIKLHTEDQDRISRGAQPIGAGFPYPIAFEDLLRTTHSSTESPLSRSIRAFPFGTIPIFGSNSMMGWMAWIHDLYDDNLLQQRETREVPRLADMIPSDAFGTRMKLSESEKVTEETQTEQDMYDHFLRWASSPSTVAATIGALDSVMTDPASFFEKQLKALDSPEGKRATRALLGEDFGETRLGKDIKSALELLSRDNLEKAANVQSPPKQDSHSSEQVVSTSTTSSRTTHEDGLVETSVTVWTRYADGSETVKTTNHSTYDTEANVCPSDVSSKNGSAIHEKRQEQDKAEKTEKKGWFWN